MKEQFFINTGIQPSILFFENTGKPTSVVEFWDVIKGANGDIEETMVLSVPRAKFDASCSFDMRRYQEVKAVANPAGFPMVKLEDIIKIIGGKRRTIQEATEDGEYDFITCSIMGTSRINVADFTKEAIIINAINGSGKCRPYYSNRYSTTTNNIHFTLKDDCKNVILKYVYRYLELNSNLLEEGFNGGNQKKIGQEYIKTISILLPPIETQQEIVATLDRIYAPGTTELAETLKLTDKAMDLVLADPGGASLEPIVEAQRLMRKSAQMVADVKAQMVADVKAQMVAIMKSVGHRGFHTGKVGDNISFMNGYAFKSEEFLDSGVPIVKIKNIKSSILSFEKAQYSKQDTKLSKYAVKQGDMVISLTGELSGDVGINLTGVEWYLNQRVARIDITNKELLPQYMYYYLVYSGFTEAVRNLSTGSAQPNVSTKNIESLTLPLPPIEFQESIIMRLNALQIQLSSLENLGKQAEDNARFILDSYLNTA
jgi:restriction endonuclease S subunit